MASIPLDPATLKFLMFTVMLNQVKLAYEENGQQLIQVTHSLPISKTNPVMFVLNI